MMLSDEDQRTLEQSYAHTYITSAEYKDILIDTTDPTYNWKKLMDEFDKENNDWD